MKGTVLRLELSTD